MPIYEYRCESCGHELDALQKLSDGPLQDCPDCQAPSLRRLISAPSFRLKGDGWYETDFKSDKETKRNLVESPDAKVDKGETAKKADKPSGDKPSKKAELSSKSKSDSKSGSGSGANSGSSKDPGSAAA
jgi:putative FmdB family regulatory protein